MFMMKTVDGIVKQFEKIRAQLLVVAEQQESKVIAFREQHDILEGKRKVALSEGLRARKVADKIAALIE